MEGFTPLDNVTTAATSAEPAVSESRNESSAASTAWGVVKSASSVFLPWIVVLYVWWVGLHWTIIGMAAIYVASLLVAIGCVIGETRGR